MNSPTPRPKATLESFLAVIDALRLTREEEQRLTRKDREDEKLARLKPWWLDAAQ